MAAMSASRFWQDDREAMQNKAAIQQVTIA
jgi:hypothetical protein